MKGLSEGSAVARNVRLEPRACRVIGGPAAAHTQSHYHGGWRVSHGTSTIQTTHGYAAGDARLVATTFVHDDGALHAGHRERDVCVSQDPTANIGPEWPWLSLKVEMHSVLTSAHTHQRNKRNAGDEPAGVGMVHENSGIKSAGTDRHWLADSGLGTHPF